MVHIPPVAQYPLVKITKGNQVIRGSCERFKYQVADLRNLLRLSPEVVDRKARIHTRFEIACLSGHVSGRDN